MREDVAFAHAEHGVSERRACKLLGVDRAGYRYEILDKIRSRLAIGWRKRVQPRPDVAEFLNLLG